MDVRLTKLQRSMVAAEFRARDGYVIELHSGFQSGRDASHCVQAKTKTEAYRLMSEVKRCDCVSCRGGD